MDKTRVHIFENKHISNNFDEYLLDGIIDYSVRKTDNYQFPIIDIGEDDNIIQNEMDAVRLSKEYSKEDILNIKNSISEIKSNSSRFNDINKFLCSINFSEEATSGLSKNMQNSIKTLEETSNEVDTIEDIINDKSAEVIELSGLDIDSISAKDLYPDHKNDAWVFKRQTPERKVNPDISKEWEYQNKNTNTQEVNFEHEFKKSAPPLNNENIDINELLNDDLEDLLVSNDTLRQIENNIENADINHDHINEMSSTQFLEEDDNVTIDEDILNQMQSDVSEVIEENGELLEEIIDNPETTISYSFLEGDDDVSIDDETLSSIENTLKNQEEINIEYINEDDSKYEEENTLKDNEDEFPIDEIYDNNIIEVVENGDGDINSGSFNGEFTQDNLDDAIKRYEDGVDNDIHSDKEIDIMVTSYDANRLSNMLSFIDSFVKSLPEDKQSEFAKSEHYDTYMSFVKKVSNL